MAGLKQEVDGLRDWNRTPTQRGVLGGGKEKVQRRVVRGKSF